MRDMSFTGKRGSRGLLGSVMALVFVAAALPAAAADTADVRSQMNQHLRQCTERHGYDPEAALEVGPHALGAGERQWRECVYQAVEKYLIPNTLSPELYRRAIAEDREITEGVASGRMTRAQRRARVQALLDEIDRREEANRLEIERQAATRLMQEELRRQQEMMRMRDMRNIMRPLGR